MWSASRASLYNSDGRARVRRHVGERPVDCSTQTTDKFHEHDNQSYRGWPWTHYQISDETSADGSSSASLPGACVTNAKNILIKSL